MSHRENEPQSRRKGNNVVSLKREVTAEEFQRARVVRSFIKEQAGLQVTPVSAIVLRVTAEGQILTDDIGIVPELAGVIRDELLRVAARIDDLTHPPDRLAEIIQLRPN